MWLLISGMMDVVRFPWEDEQENWNEEGKQGVRRKKPEESPCLMKMALLEEESLESFICFERNRGRMGVRMKKEPERERGGNSLVGTGKWTFEEAVHSLLRRRWSTHSTPKLTARSSNPTE